MSKCNRDCFNCKFADCIIDDVSKYEDFMQKYRDASATVTGILPKAHTGKNTRKNMNKHYTSSCLYGVGKRQ